MDRGIMLGNGLPMSGETGHVERGRTALSAHRGRRVKAAPLRVGAALCTAGPLIGWVMDCADARPRSNTEQWIAAKKAESDEIPRGPLEIIISINKQRISLYAGENLVARSSVSTGKRGHPTPLGVFTVIQKQKWHRSNLYSAAPMPYMQRITWSGVALHAGVLPGYPASHGCIRLTYEFATRLWHLTRTGTRVIIAHGEVAPVEIVNRHLFAPAPKPPEATNTEVGGPDRDPSRGLKTAAAATSEVPAIADVYASDGAPRTTPSPTTPRKAGPISVLISRKDGKLFVRQGSIPLFDSPVTIQDPQTPLGTHVLTVGESSIDAAMHWTVVSIPERADRNAESAGRDGRTQGRRSTDPPTATPAVEVSPSADAALDRIDIPKETVDRISPLLVPGSSLIISDHGVSNETDSDTDFIVLTR